MIETMAEMRSKTPHELAPNGVIVVTNLELLTLVVALLVVLLVSQRLKLGVETSLFVGAVRCFVQLSILGLVLVPIILYSHAPLVVGYVVFMMFVGSIEAAARPPYVFDSIILVCFVAIAATVGMFSTFAFTCVIQTGMDAQYIIPVTGMLTGTATSAVSVAMSNIVTEFAERKSNMEALLAMGATRWEASFDIFRSSILLGLTPTLNLLSVTGLVSIPGMMTGQIIGGTPPSLAAKYQLVIMYIGAGTASIATLIASALTIRVLIDSQHRIQNSKLLPRESVNRIESIISTARFVASSLSQWRTQVNERRTPFPSYVEEQLPSSENESLPSSANEPPPNTEATPLTESSPKIEGSSQRYGGTCPRHRQERS